MRYELIVGWAAVTDWDALESYWRHVMEDRLAMNPAEHPVLLADAVLAPKADRARWAELMFEKFRAPGVFIGKEPVLAWCVLAPSCCWGCPSVSIFLRQAKCIYGSVGGTLC